MIIIFNWTWCWTAAPELALSRPPYANITAPTPATIIAMASIFVASIRPSSGSFRTFDAPMLSTIPSPNTNSGLVAITVEAKRHRAVVDRFQR